MTKSSMKLVPVGVKHEGLYRDLLEVLARYDLSNIEILAVTANLVGKVCAMQDQRKYTAADVLEIVFKNIEHGNRQALKNFLEMPTEGSA